MKSKILVVDDEPDAVELIEFNLQAAGYEVVTASDGEEALKKARSLLPALIILDLMLPAVDGLEVCKILRRDPKTQDIPLIMVTAKAAEIDRVLGLVLGAEDYITKPFDVDVLLAHIKAVLRRSARVAAITGRPTPISLAGLTIDPLAHTVTSGVRGVA